jgi:hypothetical protein
MYAYRYLCINGIDRLSSRFGSYVGTRGLEEMRCNKRSLSFSASVEKSHDIDISNLGDNMRDKYGDIPAFSLRLSYR